MSQKLVFQLLKELGGTAFNYEVADLARKKYPDRYLWHYVSQQLHALQRWGYIERDDKGRWRIIKEYEE